MYIWIWVTIAAALSQSLRTAQQKNLQPVLGNLGASFVRFSYAIPFAWAWIIFYSIFFDIGANEGYFSLIASKINTNGFNYFIV